MQHINQANLNHVEQQLDDVMEIIDITYLKGKITEGEAAYQNNPSDLTKLRLGIIYHEAALNLAFLTKTENKGYAQKSFDLLESLMRSSATPSEFLPFVVSYRASALALVGGETKSLKLLSQAFRDFQSAVTNYAAITYLPEFMRASVAENLPWIFFIKRRHAKRDLQSIIDKQSKDNHFANDKIMSFVFWGWANQHQGKGDRKEALAYLDRAIALDLHYRAGRKRAEELRTKLLAS